MVSVATGLDVPIKLEWPKSVDFSSQAGFTILGLGDIVIPGSFITMSLRYDLARSSKQDWRVDFDKPYFKAGLFAYVTGLGTTIFVMHTFKAAQPALLYLR
jgi:minor histocompatibility antigen H13